jgi:hypothetical protein
LKHVYIFLDVDGVLNHAACEGWKGLDDKLLWQCVCRDSVASLNALIEALSGRHKVSVVLSSTWRRLMTLSEFNQMMQDYGFRYEVVATTPKLAAPRGLEIQAYLDTLSEKPDAIVILDDDADMKHLLPCLVQTEYGTGDPKEDGTKPLGLRMKHVFEALRKVDIQLASLEGGHNLGDLS